ncbi:phosphatidylinositol-glycan biosynthesis class X protein isoform X2 [Punica granatum]|nr:phosphatidylinositol-glycan biosynthesis class X protein isoform X2 [Punica granatum]XP_031391770.1 phosphatidylinositol-glycan biosynthesis class X protein isoform X2 [Punica granatum]OWM88262.1 hypothetical protein CDL15_Pgr003674 [Punica granatum]PKI45356.1 hypothetical protein CRG98_034160 [Punica granatum]
MGVPRQHTFGDYPKPAILWTVLFVILSFLSDLSYSGEVVDKHDLDFHAGNVPCPKKWITEPYFEIFDSLLDSHFQDFKERTLSRCSCKPLRDTQTTELKLSGLERRLVGEGSHRQLSSSVRISVNPPTHPCEVIIIERLPSGIFADPFELQHLVQRGAFNDVAVLGDTDLELPTVRSNRTVVEIHMDVGPNSFSRHKDGQKINLHIPLHVRYPPLHESGYTKVVFGDPDIFARCSIDGRPIDETCLSTVTRDNAESSLSSVAWEVPSGIEMHAGVVSSVTFLSATVSAMIIILASIFHSDAKSCKNLKA